MINPPQKLIKLRHDCSILTNGSYHLLLPLHQAIFAYERKEINETWLVIANLKQEIQTLNLEISKPIKKIVISNYDIDNIPKYLRPYEAFICLISFAFLLS
ncbi:hypothetical protein EQ500_04020, partial [Lactobacillus sp. XV13L]|nr:hypothetical protein [Lactobacillus sp. XV13L]